MGWTGNAEWERRSGQRQPAVRWKRSGRAQPSIRSDLFQVRRAILHRRGLEMVHVLEVRGDEHGNAGVTRPRPAERDYGAAGAGELASQLLILSEFFLSKA